MAGVVCLRERLFAARRGAKMNQDRWLIVAVTTACFCVLALPGVVVAQDKVTQGVPAESPVVSDELAASKTLRSGGIGTLVREEPTASLWLDVLPDLSVPTLSGIAVVVILVLLLQSKPWLSWRNADALVLALTAWLLPLRHDLGFIATDPTGHTVQWWTYVLLSVAGLYWLARGLRLTFAKAVPPLVPNMSAHSLTVLILAGLFVASSFIVHAPQSAGSRDGLIGGIFTAETGKLPYGDAPGHDARSPLLYLLHAGSARLVEPTCAPARELLTMRWVDRAQWLSDTAWKTVDPADVQLVNATLFVLLFAAVAGIGHRFHSVAVGQILVAILCFFPGVLECLPRPEIMLPAVLLAWSIAVATLPVVGGLLSVLLLVLAGMAWPWAWLALPLMLAYFFRKGWHAVGAAVGLLAGLAAIVVGTTALVEPTIPRYGGALAEAGITPAYAARVASDGTLVIERSQTEKPRASTFKKWLWKPLLERESTRLDTLSDKPLLPNGVDAAAIMYRDVNPTPAARDLLQPDYRLALSRESLVTRTWASLRTLLETTWKPAVSPALPLEGVWDAWLGAPESAGRETLIRRISKIVAGLLALGVAVVMLRQRKPDLHRLIGGLLVVCAASLLVSMTGAVANLVWLMPAVLGALAAHGAGASPPPPAIGHLPPLENGPAPRITVER